MAHSHIDILQGDHAHGAAGAVAVRVDGEVKPAHMPITSRRRLPKMIAEHTPELLPW